MLIHVSTDACSCCSEDSKWFLEIMEDGSIKWRYKGCGGSWQFGRPKWHDQIDSDATGDEAFNVLRERRDHLRDKIERAQEELREVQSALERLRGNYRKELTQKGGYSG